MKTIKRISSKRKSKILYLKTKKGGGEEVIDLKGKNYKLVEEGKQKKLLLFQSNNQLFDTYHFFADNSGEPFQVFIKNDKKIYDLLKKVEQKNYILHYTNSRN